MNHQHPHKEFSKDSKHKENHNESLLPLAISATFHCLLGCGLGEITGMIISAWLGLSLVSSIILALVLGFVVGLVLGVVPLLRRNFTFRHALKLVIVGEGLSILVMESFELGTQLIIPGVMHAELSEPIFWLGMGAALIVGFIAALPVNYFMIKRGVRHMH